MTDVHDFLKLKYIKLQDIFHLKFEILILLHIIKNRKLSG
jgi:hypothetical protein